MLVSQNLKGYIGAGGSTAELSNQAHVLHLQSGDPSLSSSQSSYFFPSLFHFLRTQPSKASIVMV